MSSYETMYGETMTLSAEIDGGGLNGSGNFESGETVLFSVLWTHSSSGPSGITGYNWPDDFTTNGGSDYLSILNSDALSPAQKESTINSYVQRYALYRMSKANWDAFANTYDNNGYNCIRYMGE